MALPRPEYLLRAASSLSLLLLITSAALWLRSYFVEESHFWEKLERDVPPPLNEVAGGGIIALSISHGELTLGWHFPKLNPDAPHIKSRWQYRYSRDKDNQLSARAYTGYDNLDHFGFHVMNLGPLTGDPYVILVIPFYFLTFVCTLLPGAWLAIFFRTRSRQGQGFCVITKRSALPDN